jgi:hypothetical protein
VNVGLLACSPTRGRCSRLSGMTLGPHDWRRANHHRTGHTGDRVVVRKAGRYSPEDIHRALFSRPPRRRTLEEMKAGIRRAVRDAMRAVDANVLVRLINGTILDG